MRPCKAPDDAARRTQGRSMLLTAGGAAQGSAGRAWHAVLQLRVWPARSGVQEGLRCLSLPHADAGAALQPERGKRSQAAGCRRHQPLHRLRGVNRRLPGISGGLSSFPKHARWDQWHLSFATTLSDEIEARRYAAVMPGITTGASPLVAGLLAQGCQNLRVSGEPARSC